MRVKIAIMKNGEVLDDSLSISTGGPEVLNQQYEEVGKAVVAMLKRVRRHIEPIDPRDLIVIYGDIKRTSYAARGTDLPVGVRISDKRYALAHRRTYEVLFDSDSKSEVIAEAQRRKGWEVDGSEQTYAKQVAEAEGEAR